MGQANKTPGFWSAVRRVITRQIVLDSALSAYEKLDPKQQQTVMSATLRTWMLAKLNPDKARKVKERLLGGEQPSVQDRLEKLKQLHEQGLITEQEYEAKKAEIINEL